MTDQKTILTNRAAYKFLIGIDSGSNTGICIWSKKEKKIRSIATMKIHQAMEVVKHWNSLFPSEVLVRVEDARQVRFKTDPVKAQGAGYVKAHAKIWEDFLIDLGVDFEMIRPNKKLTKWTAEVFKSATGYVGQTSSHARDSALLVIGI